MGLLRGRRDSGGVKYRMREKMFAIGDDYWIDDESDAHAFKVNGKALRIRDTLVLEDPSGSELFTIQEKKLHIRDTMAIERDGEVVATIKKALVSPLRDRFSIELRDGEDMEAKGNVVNHDRRSVEAVVPSSGHLRHRHPARAGRCVPARRDRLHRPDGSRGMTLPRST